MYRAKESLKLIALLFALTLAACGDDTVSAGPNNDNNNRIDPNNVEIPEGSSLRHTGDCAGTPNCAVDLTFNSSRPLRVQLLNGNQNPIQGARIVFDLVPNDATDTTLDARTAQSDAEGFAEVNIRGGQVQGVAEVTVTVDNDDTIDPVQFVIGVSPKDSASYRVNFTHAGTANLKDINVFLFQGDVTCDMVREDLARERDDDPMTNPTLTAEATALGIANVDGTLPLVVFPGLANGDSFTVSARALSRENSEVELAFGCQDGNPPITNGNSVDVIVDLQDYIPRLKGDFNVTHTFSITDAICNPDGNGGYDGVLPSGVCLAIDLIGRLATDPASFLIGTGGGDNGLIGLIVDLLPDGGLLGDLKNAINSFLNNSIINGIGRDAINDFFEDWLADNAPSWVQSAFNITGDIYESLKEFRVAGLIRISEEPVASFDPNTGAVIGILQADMNGVKPGKQVWEDIIVYWTGDCPPSAPEACRERTFSATDLGATQTVVEGFFTGSVVPIDDPENPGYGLIIDEHTLTLNYGVLILGIIEKVVLPSIIDPSVDSLEEALDFVLTLAFGGTNGCESFGDWLENTVGGGQTVNNIANNLCSGLVESASDAVREFLTENLVLEGEDNFLLGTPDGSPCRITQPEIYSGDWIGKPLPYIQKMGTEDMQCNWEVKIKAGNTIINTDGGFYGDRSNF